MLTILIVLFTMIDIFIITLMAKVAIFNGVEVLFFVIHLGLSIILGYLLYQKICKAQLTIDKYSLIFYTALIFFMPILGVLGAIFIVWSVLYYKKNIGQENILEVSNRLSLSEVSDQYGAGSTAELLRQSDLPINSRIDALLKLSSTNQGRSNLLVNALLKDDQEELRLLAFGILEQQQKFINREISLALLELSKTENKNTQAQLKKRLALWYWELLYRHLVEENLQNFCLQQIIQYVNEAIIVLKNDPVLWALLGKVYMRLKKNDDAAKAFLKASELGAPALHVVPYFAEERYIKRDWPAVAALFEKTPYLSEIPMIGPVVSFWNQLYD